MTSFLNKPDRFPHTVDFGAHIPGKVFHEQTQWLLDRGLKCFRDYSCSDRTFRFSDQTEAIVFKLRWMGA